VTSARPPRLVSLVPSATETLLALGADVIACTRFCEQPSLRHVGGTKNPDVGAIIALAPDVVILDEEENRREDADALREAGLHLVVTSVRSVSDAMAAVTTLADAGGVEVPSRWEYTATAPARHEHRTAFVPIWRRPWMTLNADTFGASVLEQLGIELVTADAADRYPQVELDSLPSPDLVLVPSEPYDFHDDHVRELSAAFPSATVLRVDGQDLFWWGIRTPAAIARLAAAVDLSVARDPDSR
jgi:ABC-type Fe3+-hydroxamate transport system substrate-binding protein